MKYEHAYNWSKGIVSPGKPRLCDANFGVLKGDLCSGVRFKCSHLFQSAKWKHQSKCEVIS